MKSFSIASVDVLEPRLLMSGDVTVRIHDHWLTIVGDRGANVITIDDLVDGQVRLTAGDGTTINGQPGEAVFNLFEAYAGMRVRMGDGDDHLTLDGVTVRGNLRLSMGAGDDKLEFSDVTVGGYALASGRGGNDQFDLQGVDVHSMLKIRTGGGADYLTMDYVSPYYSLGVNLGSGDDIFEVKTSGPDDSVSHQWAQGPTKFQVTGNRGDDHAVFPDDATFLGLHTKLRSLQQSASASTQFEGLTVSLDGDASSDCQMVISPDGQIEVTSDLGVRRFMLDHVTLAKLIRALDCANIVADANYAVGPSNAARITLTVGGHTVVWDAPVWNAPAQMPASLQPLSNTLLDIINRPELPAKLPGEGQRFYIPGARRTQVVGQRACVLTDDGKLMIVGMSDNPRYMWEGPALWGICDFSAGIQRDMQSGVDIRVVGDMAYVAWEYGTADSGWHGGVWVIDLSHDMAPVVRSTFETDGSVLAMDVVGDRAYITDSDGVKIVDVSDPDAPMEIGIIPAVGPAKVKVAGSFAYISSGGQVQIWDISDPSAPARVGSCGTVVYTGGADQITDAEDYITRLSVAGNVAVTMDGKGFMQFIDISDPAAPRVMGTFQNSAYLDAQVQLVGSLAYVVTADQLDVVDFANPASPVLLGTQYIDSLRQVQVVGELGYLTRADGVFTCNTCNLRPIPPEPNHDGGDYYWCGDEKIPLWREPEQVEFAVDGVNEDLSNLSELFPGYQYLKTLEHGVYVFRTPEGDNGLYDPAKYPACVKWSSPVYFTDRKLHEVFNNEIDISFDSAGAKDAYIASHEDIIGVQLQAYGNRSLIFALRNGGPLDVLRLCDSLHGAPHVEWAEPNVRGGSCDV